MNWDMPKGEVRIVRFNNGMAFVGLIGERPTITSATSNLFQMISPLKMVENLTAPPPADATLYQFMHNSEGEIGIFKMSDIFTVSVPAEHIMQGYIKVSEWNLQAQTDIKKKNEEAAETLTADTLNNILDFVNTKKTYKQLDGHKLVDMKKSEEK